MMQFNPNTLWVAIVLLLAGCDIDTNAELEKKIESASAQISVLQSETASLKKELAEQKSKREFDNLIQTIEKVAYLTPGTDGYSPIKFDLGVLTVQLADVKPYANGSKITLRFGNTLSSSINGLKATIDWGKLTEKGGPANDSAKSKEVTFTESLRAGGWTPVSVVLEGIPATELGFVRVREVAHAGIQLSGR